MIIVRLSDGLGNQMFQYAMGLALARRRGVPLRLDPSAYQRDPKRRFALDRLQVEANFVSAEEAAAVLIRPHDRGHPWWDQPVVVEPHFHYAENIWEVPTACYLVGYWQSERYFAAVAAELRERFVPPAPLEGRRAELAAEIAAVSSVALHFRRGDYVNDPRVSRLHGICSVDYYRAAILHVAARVPNPVFFVFSDEIEWVRHNLRLAFPMRLVDHGGEAVEDLRLMSLCRHHILANSSFGWWGAWLGRHDGQQVCAPHRWFAGYSHDTRDLIPAAWVRLPG